MRKFLYVYDQKKTCDTIRNKHTKSHQATDNRESHIVVCFEALLHVNMCMLNGRCVFSVVSGVKAIVGRRRLSALEALAAKADM